MAKQERTNAPVFKRAGLHKLECEQCGGYVYATVAQLEANGLPTCGCGGRFVPDELELAMLLGVECPATAEYWRELSSVEHGQAGASGCGRRDTSGWRTPESIAAERVAKRRRERALSNRLGALRPVAEPLPF